MKYLKYFESSFWDKRNLDELDRKDIVDELNDISYDLKDDGFDLNVEEWYYQPGHRQFIICRVIPGDKDEIDGNLIETTMRIIDCMNQRSYDLGSNNWVQNGEGRLRVKRKVDSSYYLIEPKELKEFISCDFEIIELVFDPLI